MEPNYLVGYTMFGVRYKSGFKTSYRHFETKESVLRFIKYKQIEEGSYVIYKRIDIEQ